MRQAPYVLMAALLAFASFLLFLLMIVQPTVAGNLAYLDQLPVPIFGHLFASVSLLREFLQFRASVVLFL